MFKVSQSATVTWPVKVAVPIDGGKTESFTFDVVFKRLPQERIDQLVKEFRSEQGTEAALAAEIVVGWKGVQYEDGGEMTFSEAARDQVFDVYPVRGSVIEAWFDYLKAGRKKN